MTTPPVPTSPSQPILGRAATDAITAARQRVGALTQKRVPVPPRPMSTEEKKAALQEVTDGACEKCGRGGACRFCGSLHVGSSTPACPRLATFKVDGDGRVTEGSFWPDGVTDIAVECDSQGNVTGYSYHVHGEWDTSQVVRVADAHEEDSSEEEGKPDDAA